MVEYSLRPLPRKGACMLQVRLTSLGQQGSRGVGVDILGAFYELEQLGAGRTHGIALIESVTNQQTTLLIGADSLSIRLSERTCLTVAGTNRGTAYTFNVRGVSHSNHTVLVTFQ